MLPSAFRRCAYRALSLWLTAFVLAACLDAAESGNKRFVHLQFPSGTIMTAEVADTPHEVRTGLMFRKFLEAGEGMFFIFPYPDFHSFWMKNTKIPLDIIWLSPEFSIVHLEQNAKPCPEDPCPSYRSMQKAQYVLEVNAGVVCDEGLSLGDMIILLDPLPEASE